MDQARWLVILSVIICMTVSLAFLQRIAAKPAVIVESPAADVESKRITAKIPDKVTAAEGAVNYGQIRFPAPPGHLFSVNSAAEITRENELTRDSGKIIE